MFEWIKSFFKKKKRIPRSFSSIMDARFIADGAAKDMMYCAKESVSYKEAEEMLNDALEYIKEHFQHQREKKEEVV